MPLGAMFRRQCFTLLYIMSDHSALLIAHGVRPTANRLLVANELARSLRPLSLAELEECMPTMDKSSIFRALAVFREHHLVHVIEDGGDGVRYELCRSHDATHDNDLHAHFFCEQCHRTFCIDNTPVPAIPLPDGFRMNTVNYLVKGICAECRARAK